MGSRNHDKRRQAAIAAVKAGTISAADAYRTMDGSGSLTRGLLEPYEAEAKVFGNGIWKDLTGTQKVAAHNAMSGLKAAASANAPKTEAEKAAERALPSSNAMVNQAAGYKLNNAASQSDKIASLEAERAALTETSNRMGGLATNAARIEQIASELNALRGQTPTITPEQAAASFTKSLEITPEQAAASVLFKSIPEEAVKLFPSDAKAQAAYIQEYNRQLEMIKGNGAIAKHEGRQNLGYTAGALANAERAAKAAAQRWIDEPQWIRWVSEPIDNLINGDSTGILARAAETGAGATFGLGPGNTSNSGSPPNVDALVNNFINDAKAVNSGMNNVSAPGVNPNGSNVGGSTMPGFNPSQGQAPTDPFFTPTNTSGTPTLTNPTGTNAGNLPTNPANPGTPGATPTLTNPTGTNASNLPTLENSVGRDALAGNPSVPVTPSNTQVPPVTPPGSTSTNNTGSGDQTGSTPPVTPPVVPPVTPPVVPPVTGGGMSALEITALVTSLVSAGMSVWQANEVAKNAVEAAKVQAAAADKATQLQRDMYDRTRADLAPWRAAGEEALGYTGQQDAAGNWIARPSGGLRTFNQDNADFQMNPFEFRTGMNQNADGSAVADPYADPSYAFRFSEGLKAVENSAAAKGMLRSGNTLKAISDYGQGSASQEYNNAFNRYQTQRTNSFNEHNINRGQKLNVLQSLAGVGQTAVGQTANAGQNYATGGGNAMMTGANVRADGINSAAAATAAGWNGAAAVGNNYLSQALNRSTGLDYAKRFGYGG